jgi:ATP-binding cassette subfamily B protein
VTKTDKPKIGLELIKPYFRQNAGLLALGFAALAVCDLGQMVIPRIVGHIFDLLADYELSIRIIWPALALLLGLAALVAFLRYVWRHMIYGFSRRLEMDMRQKLQSRFLSLSLSWHQTNYSGDMMALSTNDIDAVRMAVGFGLVSLVDALVLGLSAVGFMLSIDPYLSLWAFIPMPLISILTARFGRAIFARMLEVQDVFGQLTEIVREQLSGFKIIRAMTLERLSQAEVSRVSQFYMKKNVHLALVMGGFFPMMTLLTNLALALALYVGGKATIVGDISPGDFVAFITYLALLSWPMLAMGMTLGIIQSGLASLARLARVMEAEETTSHPSRTSFPDPDGPFEIIFDKVRFAYPQRHEPVLNELSLILPAGKLCAVAGPTGSGKSTLAALLPALYEPSAGHILVNGRPSTEWPLERLRGLFGYVPQEGHVFTGTLRQNLAFGRPGADDDSLVRVAEAAALPIDPAIFPQGLDTMIGERGLTLSGGQRQRLALARALLIDPPYLILDDTLSAVDAAVEEEILSRLAPLRAGRGGLIISHRITSLSKASTVAVLEDGRITQEGTFEEIISQEGYLSRIAELARLGADGFRPSRSWRGTLN